MTYGTINVDKVVNSDNVTSGGLYGFKNRIINGAMVIDQRNAGASVSTSSGNSVFCVDRWFGGYIQTGKFTMQQNAGSVTPPNGFKNYLGVTSSSAYSVLSGDTFYVAQRIEGLNAYDLMWGSSTAQTITLSFWVRSSLTGTFGGSLVNQSNNRSYPFTYTVNSVSTWEQKSITIAGDQSGTWIMDTNIGIQVIFNLGTGSTYSGTANTWQNGLYLAPTGATSVVGTNGATFYITGVQFEKGSTATSFDYRPYGTELALCQRYYEKSFATTTAPVTNIGIGTGEVLTAANPTVGNGYALGAFYRVTKRTTATVTLYNRAAASNSWTWYTSGGTSTNAGTLEAAGYNSFAVQFPGGTTATITTGHWTADAEL